MHQVEAERVHKRKGADRRKSCAATTDGRAAQGEGKESSTIADARGFHFSTRRSGKTVAESSRCETCNFRRACAHFCCEATIRPNAARLCEEACVVGAEFESRRPSFE